MPVNDDQNTSIQELSHSKMTLDLERVRIGFIKLCLEQIWWQKFLLAMFQKIQFTKTIVFLKPTGVV